MNRQNISPSPLQQTTLVLASTVVILLINACRPKSETNSQDAPEAIYVAQLHENSLASEDSSFLTSQTTSAIHWQPWDKNIFTHASSERKTILAFIGSGTDANSIEILKILNRSAASCNLLNEHHVNVLIDSNRHPDLEFFAASLCIKSGSPVSTPLLIWFSYEGHPISWVAVDPHSSHDIHELISRMSNTVYRLWQDDPEYVLQNSRDDFKRRKASLPTPPEQNDPLIPIRALRQTASLFDPTSNTIDGMGSMSSARYIELLIAGSHHPDISDTQRASYAKVATIVANKNLLQGIIDPLDGGTFSGIQQTTSALPSFTKTLKAQAHTMSALYSLYQVSGDQKHLQAANAILAYTEKHLALPDGGYSLGIVYAENNAQDNPCIWTLEEIEAALTEEEARICTIAFGLRGLGNIPLLDDRDRSYFRKNTLTWKLTLAELATQTSIDMETLKQGLESITKKLAKLRTEKPPKATKENLSTAESIALFTSSCISAYRVTGNTDHLNRATKALTFIRKNFLDDSSNLHRARYNGELQSHPGTGTDHALVCQAALDLHEVTFDATWLKFASNVHQRMHLMLGDPANHSIKEYDGTGYPQSYDVYQFYTLRVFDNIATWSIAYSNAKRLARQEASDTLKAQYEALTGILLQGASASAAPISSIDFLTAEAQLLQKTVYLNTPATSDLSQVAQRSTCQIIPIVDGGNYPELNDADAKIPTGSATVILRGKVIGTTSNPDELTQLLK